MRRSNQRSPCVIQGLVVLTKYYYFKSRVQIFIRLGHRPTTHTRLKAEATYVPTSRLLNTTAEVS